MATAWNRNRLTGRLGVDYPIIQGPLGGLSSPRLTAAVSGFEAGGHRGSFLRPTEDSLTGTNSLVPQVVDTVGAPVIAAGGIADARGVAAALALGAEGVQKGTVFLTCEESGASRLHRGALRGPEARHTA
jgi:nitronate monooxygenase